MASELEPCPFCSKTMMLRSALWPSEGDADAIIHADPTDCPMLGFSDGSADGSIIEKWNCSLSNEDDFPSDGSCVRCGSVPRNANGLCNTCLDEDAERLENTRTTPVAPVSPDTDGKCGELEPMRIEVCKGIAGLALYVNDERICGPRHNGRMETVLSGAVDAVTRSQAEALLREAQRAAEELLAAERAEKDGWKELHDAAQVAVKERTEACDNLYKQVNDLKADCAAKDARVEFLERVWKKTESHTEALEAKLAAAEKALEGLREKGRKVLDVLKAWEDDSDLVNSGKIVSDFRAVLGGKPS